MVLPITGAECKTHMEKINGYIREGAISFLRKEYTYLSIFCTFFAILLFFAVDYDWANEDEDAHIAFPYTTVSFLIGAITSMAAGYIGMQIATITNVKTTYLCNIDINEGFNAAFQGGQVLGFTLVGLALLVFEILLLAYRSSIIGAEESIQGDGTATTEESA